MCVCCFFLEYHTFLCVIDAFQVSYFSRIFGCVIRSPIRSCRVANVCWRCCHLYIHGHTIIFDLEWMQCACFYDNINMNELRKVSSSAQLMMGFGIEMSQPHEDIDLRKMQHWIEFGVMLLCGSSTHLQHFTSSNCFNGLKLNSKCKPTIFGMRFTTFQP